MSAAENIESLIKKFCETMKSSITASEEMDKKVLNDALAIYEKFKTAKTAHLQPYVWRIIMRSKITRLAAVAVIIIACSTGLILWRSTGSGITLADVLTRIEQVTCYMYRLSSTITKQQNISEWAYTVLITQKGIKLKSEMMDPEPENKEFVLPEMYLLPHKNALIALSHETKTYISMKFEDTMMESLKKYNDPTAITKQILSCIHTSLGQSVIDGITVEGFHTTDPAYKGGFFGQADLQREPVKVDVKIWVDVNTFLPVRSEEDILTKDGMHLHEVSSDFHWNVPVDEAGFEPEIPDDYQSAGGVGDITVPACNEENTIKGLKLFVDLAGEYPDNLSKETLEEAMKLTGIDATSWKDLTDDEKTKITNDYYIIRGPAEFYETLVLDEKEPAYYGQSVTLKDSKMLLMRWKVSDNEYRVIFGDLSVKTVTAEELAELERQ